MNRIDRQYARVYLSPYQDTYELMLIKYESSSDKIYASTKIEWEEQKSGFVYPQSPFTMSRTEAQDLMDQLWRCGLRPTEGSGSAGSLAATERHLGDMQKIVFGLLGKHGVK